MVILLDDDADFDGDGVPDEINFMIKRIKVHTEQALNEASYRFPGNYGVEKFLELFSGTFLSLSLRLYLCAQPWK